MVFPWKRTMQPYMDAPADPGAGNSLNPAPPDDDPPVDPVPSDPPSDPPVDPPTDPPAPEPQKVKVKYNKEEREITLDEAVQLAQKGLNYDKVQGKAQTYEASLQRAAKIQGFDSVEAYLAAVEQAERDAEQEEQERLYAENPTEAIRAAVQRELNATQERERAYQTQKAALKDRPFFSDLESEIDRIYQDGLKNGNALDLNTLYSFAFGNRGPELIEQVRKNASQSALAQVQDRARRGVVGQDSNHSDDDIDMSDVDLEMASAFGNDPKEIAKYKHQQTKRK